MYGTREIGEFDPESLLQTMTAICLLQRFFRLLGDKHCYTVAMETATQSAIDGGVATIFTTDMDRAVRFYTETLGLKLVFRAGEHWAQVDAGKGFMIGLHPTQPGSRELGSNGGIQVGFD